MPFVISSGKLAGLNSTIYPAVPAPITVAGGTWLDHATLYRSQPQVRTVVSFLARNIAQLGLHVFKRVGDNDRQRLRDYPLARIIDQPAAGTKMTRYKLITRLVSDLAIYDSAYWVKVRPDAQNVAGVIPVPVSRIAPIGSNWVTPEGYRIHGARGDIVLPPDQVVHFHGYSPDDLRTGESPLSSLQGVLSEEYEASRHRQQMWRNGARTSGFLTRPPEAPQWSDGARKRFKEEFRAVYTGDGPLAGGVPILEDGMSYTPAGLDPKSAQYIEGRKLTREEVAAAYHIAPPLVGILDHATFSNIKEQHKQLYQDTLGPWLTQIREDIALQLLPDFPDSDGVYVEFNIAEKLSGSFEEQAAQLQTSVGAPWMTRNEARARVNLPAVDGGDDLITPLNVLVGGQASPTDSAPELAS